MRATVTVDLHTHSRASDGRLTPAALVARAREAHLEGLALTDHDSTEGLDEALEAGRDLGLVVVPGLELSTEWRDEDVHLLGYFLDYKADWLRERLARRRDGRLRRAEKMVRRLQELGLAITLERVLSIAGEAAVGRPHVAEALREKGYVATIEEAFQRYLNRGAPAYVPRTHLSPQEGVEIIRRAGGVAVLAHPGLVSDRSIISLLAGRGLGGLEVYYPEHDPATTAEMQEVARRYGLLATGGSDFHGDGERATLGQAGVDMVVVRELRRLAGLVS